MRKKGFTLIELLAVIVILAIIAVIATPLILNVIDEVKKGAFKSSVYGIIEASELEYAQSILKGNRQVITFTYTDGIESSSVEGVNLKYKGTKPKNGQIQVNSQGKVAIAIHDGKYCAEKGFEDSEVIISEKDIEECQISGDVEEPIAANFIKTFGGWNEDRFLGVSATSNGYIAVGYSYSVDGDLLNIIKGFQDAIIVKYDLNGNVVWKKTYGGSSNDYFK